MSVLVWSAGGAVVAVVRVLLAGWRDGRRRTADAGRLFLPLSARTRVVPAASEQPSDGASLSH